MAKKKKKSKRSKSSRKKTSSKKEEKTPEPSLKGESTEASSKKSKGKKRPKEDAISMAAKQRDISVSEFFAKNRHLLGFDNPSKALLTTIKEAVDNSLDACEEASILPELAVWIKQLDEDRFKVIVEDNGPGIVKSQVPKIFGKLLYGSKFHTLKQSRGQQGIGISAACMYAQLTTGKTVHITSRISKSKQAHHFEMRIDTKANSPVVVNDKVIDYKHDHGTKIELELQGIYKKGRHSVDGYLQQIALANPHATITYYPPKKEGEKTKYEFKRVVNELPEEPLEILPHPYGVELGVLERMARATKAHSIVGFLSKDFSRVSTNTAKEICKTAGIDGNRKSKDLSLEEVEKIYKAIQKTKIMAPSSNCLSPIGEDWLLKGLKQNVEADFYASTSRNPAVYRGNPFQIEIGMAWGGKLNPEDLCTLYRYANRVPLQYLQSACAITKSAISNSWRNYGVAQSKGALPTGPLVILVHMASVWVPFTSESKEAIAAYPEITKELKLALQECSRKLQIYLRRRQREYDAAKKKSYIEKYIPHVAIALREILELNDKQEKKIVVTLKDTLEKSRAQT